MKDYYFILGLPKAADKHRIKKAYRDRVKELHPDKANTSENRQKFLEAQEAYETLTDDARKAEYDRKLKDQREGSPVSVSGTSGKPGPRRRPGRSPVEDTQMPGFGRRPQNTRQLRAEIILSPEEAAEGGRFRLSVPIRQPCPHCWHASLLERCFCPACRGQGQSRYQKSTVLDIPPNIAHGTSFQQLVDDRPGTRTYLDITILIDSNA